MSGGDIALLFDQNIEALSIDTLVAMNDLVSEDGIRTAVIISLFTDRRANDEELPENEKSKRGWWGDLFPDVEGDQIGSKLWLLSREKRTNETLNRAIDYAEEALGWMTDDGLADSVSVGADFDASGFLILTCLIQKPDDSNLTYRFKVKWATEADHAD